jgi:hypothetical protein
MAIDPSEELEPQDAPKIPEEEITVSEDVSEPEYNDDEEYEESDEEYEDEEESDISDAILTVVEYFADLIADAVILKLEEKKNDIS